MEKKSQDFSIQEAKRLAETREGQELMRLLQKKDNAALEKAMADASAGNFKDAGKALSSMLSSPEIRQLLRQLGGKHGGL